MEINISISAGDNTVTSSVRHTGHGMFDREPTTTEVLDALDSVVASIRRSIGPTDLGESVAALAPSARSLIRDYAFTSPVDDDDDPPSTTRHDVIMSADGLSVHLAGKMFYAEDPWSGSPYEPPAGSNPFIAETDREVEAFRAGAMWRIGRGYTGIKRVIAELDRDEPVGGPTIDCSNPEDGRIGFTNPYGPPDTGMYSDAALVNMPAVFPGTGNQWHRMSNNERRAWAWNANRVHWSCFGCGRLTGAPHLEATCYMNAVDTDAVMVAFPVPLRKEDRES